MYRSDTQCNSLLLLLLLRLAEARHRMISSRGPGETDDLSEALALEWGRLRAMRMAAVGRGKGWQKKQLSTAPPLPPQNGSKYAGNGSNSAHGAFAPPKDPLQPSAVAGEVSLLESVASGADVLCEMRVSGPSSIANEALGTTGGSVQGVGGTVNARVDEEGTCSLPAFSETGLRGSLWCGWKQPSGSILSEPSCGGSREDAIPGSRRSTRISFSQQLELGPTLAYS